MAIGIGSVAVLVNDAKKATVWYRDVLGFEVVNAVGHAVFLRPRGGGTMIHLCSKCESWENDRPGGRTGVWLQCGPLRTTKDEKTGMVIVASDPTAVEKTYKELRSKGVRFSEELKTEWWGKMAIMQDPEGNEFEIS
jgi:catechol 2,3-dioxygenase-like lactoylglutathione lyase family enzyme